MKQIIAGLLCLVCAVALLFPAAAETASITTRQYTRNAQNNLSFSYEAMVMPHCTVAFGPPSELASEDMAELATDFEEIAAWLWNAFPGAALQKPTLYLLGHTGREVPYAQGSELFVNYHESDVSGVIAVMMQAMLGSDERWKAEGCAAYADALYYGESGLNESLAEMYATREDTGMLSLLPTRFSPALNTPEDLVLARQSALSLVMDLLAMDGPKAISQEVSPERMAQWRQRAGLPQDADPDRAAVLRQFTYTFGQISDLTVTGEHLSYTMNTGDAGLADAKAVEDFLYSNARAREALLAYIQSNASAENAAYFSAALPDLHYKCREPQGGDKSWFVYPDNIVLYDARLSTYTMASAMLWQPGANPLLRAGLAVYLDFKQPDSAFGLLISQQILNADPDSGFAPARELYIAWAGEPTEQTLDLRTANDAIAAYENTLRKSAELDLPQCGSLMYYIIDQYGLDTALSYIRLGQTEQEAFGKTFNMLHKEWSMALQRKGAGN